MTNANKILLDIKYDISTNGAQFKINMANQQEELFINIDELDGLTSTLLCINPTEWSMFVSRYTQSMSTEEAKPAREKAKPIDEAPDVNPEQERTEEEVNSIKQDYNDMLGMLGGLDVDREKVIADIISELASQAKLNINDIMLPLLAKNCKSPNDLTNSALGMLGHIMNSDGILDKKQYIENIVKSLQMTLSLYSKQFDANAAEVQKGKEPKAAPAEQPDVNPKPTDAPTIDTDSENGEYNKVGMLLVHDKIKGVKVASKATIIDTLAVNIAIALDRDNFDISKYPTNSVKKLTMTDAEIHKLHDDVTSYVFLESKVFVEVKGTDAADSTIRDIILSIHAVFIELGISIKNLKKHRIIRTVIPVQDAEDIVVTIIM